MRVAWAPRCTSVYRKFDCVAAHTSAWMCLRIFTSHAFNANKSFFPVATSKRRETTSFRCSRINKINENCNKSRIASNFHFSSHSLFFFSCAIFLAILTSCRGAHIYCVRYFHPNIFPFIISNDVYDAYVCVCKQAIARMIAIYQSKTHVAKTV